MSKFDDYLNVEEGFQPKGKRENRKARHVSRIRDRSKYKKSNQDQQDNTLNRKTLSLHTSFKRGRVLHISSEVITIATEQQTYRCILKGSLKETPTKQKNIIAIGDWVRFKVKDNHSGSIVHVEKRSSFLARSDNFSRRKQHLIAVNIDQVFIVMSVVNPIFKPFLIDRYVLSTIKGKMQPIILINKIDLFTHPIKTKQILSEKMLLEEFLHAYQHVNHPIIQLSAFTGKNLDQLKTLMQGKTSVFAGQSGVGKSSLINAVLDNHHLPIGKIVKKTGKGSHTTSSAQLIPLKRGGFCVDTPGIKSFGIYELSSQEIMLAFPDFVPYAQHCKFSNCTHIHEPNCMIKKALETQQIHPLRYNAYTTLFQDIAPKEWE